MGNTQDTAGFFGGGVAAAKFESHGDKVIGKVTEKELRQQTDFDTGKPLTWNDGSPRMQLVVTLQIAEPTEEDEGLRNLYVRGQMTRAIRDALKDAKVKDLSTGHTVTVEYIGDDKPARKGVSGAKQYKASVDTDRAPF
jgi:hypothetical protein